MKWFWGSRTPRCGLGLLLTNNGLALAQSQVNANKPGKQQAWYWQSLGATDAEQNSWTSVWPDPAQLRLARAQSGFQAQAIAVAVPEQQLQRFNVSLEPGMTPRQMRAAIASQLAALLSWPVSEAVWDFEVIKHQALVPVANGHQQPAWLQAALQTQGTSTADVLVMTRAWMHACEQWCRAAGLQLVRLEPPWQASARWQQHLQNHEVQAADQTSEMAQALTMDQQAVLGGLSLGVVTP